VNISFDDKELRRSIRPLGSVLTRVLKTQARPEIAATVEQLQRRFAGLLGDDSRVRYATRTLNPNVSYHDLKYPVCLPC
jgi:hypothetical protein